MTPPIKLDSLFRNYAKNFIRPDGSSCLTLELSDAQAIAEKTCMPLYDIEVAALRAKILPKRYSRNQKSLTLTDQLRLLQSHIAIIGLGGLGGSVTEIMARIGVGNITLIDGDIFEESNLNRQLLSSVHNLGETKASIGARRVTEVNPAVRAIAREEFFSAKNSARLLEDVDLAIDCLDSIIDRFVLEKACRKVGIPFISAAIAGTSGQLTVIYPDDLGLISIYGSLDKQTKGVEATLGTLPFTALYMAAAQCAEITTLLLGKKSNLKNRLFIADVIDHSTETFHLKSK